MTARIFRFVTHDRVDAYTELGWTDTKSLRGTHHGAHATVMEWTAPGAPPEPEAKEVPLAG